MMLGLGVERVTKVETNFLLVVSDFSICPYFLLDSEEMEQK